MGNEFFSSMVALGTAIVLVAIVALIVSQKSQTPAVIQAGGSAFSNALNVAVSPVTGSSITGDLGYPGQSSLGINGWGG